MSDLLNNITLREAELSDSDLIFRWRNDPWIIAKGSLNKTVEKEEHENWFSNFIQNPHSHMYIININDEPAGQVRFMGKKDQKYAEISIYLRDNYVGQGNGVKALKQACQNAFDDLHIETIIAFILKENEQSRRAFEKAGFIPLEQYNMIDSQSIETKAERLTYCYSG